MIAMPYILVGIVLDFLSLILFCVTSAALLARWPRAGFYLPARFRDRRMPAFFAHLAVLAAVSMLVLLVGAKLWHLNLHSPWVADALFCIGLVNAAVLLYLFLERRYLLSKPQLLRQLLFGTVSVAVTSVSAVAVIVAVTVLFVIR